MMQPAGPYGQQGYPGQGGPMGAPGMPPMMPPGPMGAPGMPPMMPPGPGYMPPGINNPNQLAQMAPKFTLQQMLMSMSGVFIKQKFELLEALSGCETANKYYVYQLGGDQQKSGMRLLRCKERSGWCNRNCLSPECRPFKMECTNLHNNNVMCIDMVRECQCSFLCWNRPQMKIYFTENGKREYFGKIVDNFDCCNYSFSVKDAAHNTIYHVEADCCQMGLCFMGCPCEQCEKVKFDIFSGDKQLKLPVPLTKKGKGCLKNMLGNDDNFSIPFPAGANFRDRVLLLALALFIDYRMFEESQDGNSGTSVGRLG